MMTEGTSADQSFFSNGDLSRNFARKDREDTGLAGGGLLDARSAALLVNISVEATSQWPLSSPGADSAILHSPIANSSCILQHSSPTDSVVDSFSTVPSSPTSVDPLYGPSATSSFSSGVIHRSVSELSFVTADSPATSAYASAEDSPSVPTPPTCVRAAAATRRRLSLSPIRPLSVDHDTSGSCSATPRPGLTGAGSARGSSTVCERNASLLPQTHSSTAARMDSTRFTAGRYSPATAGGASVVDGSGDGGTGCRQSFDPTDIVDVDATSLTMALTADDTLSTTTAGPADGPRATPSVGGLDLSSAGAVWSGGGGVAADRLDSVAELSSLDQIGESPSGAGVCMTGRWCQTGVATEGALSATEGAPVKCQAVKPMLKVPAVKSTNIANVTPMVGKCYSTVTRSGKINLDSEFIHGADDFSDALDALESHSNGQLAPALARNSLYVNFDPILGRPSVAPVVKQLRSSKDEAVYDTRAERVKHKVRQDLISFSPSNSSGTQCTTHSADSQLSAECPPPGHSLTTGGQQKQSVPLPAASSETAGLSDPPASSSDYSLQQQQQYQHRSDETTAAAADTDLCDSEPQRDVITTSTCTSTATASTTTVGHSSFAQQLERRQSEERRLQDCVDKLQQQLNSAQSSLNKSRLMGELSTSSLLLTTAELLLLAKQTEKEGQALRRERDEARAEVASLETMFSDLHRRYDRTKQMLSEKCIECEQRGEQLKDALEHVTREAHKYDMLQQYAESTILQTRADIDGERKSHQAELLALSARLKLAVHKETKLEQENQELTALCDELIQKMGAPR